MASDRQAWGDAVTAAYGFDEAQLSTALDNIEPRWRMDQAYIDQAAVLGEQSLQLAQIPREPDYESVFDTTFVDALAEENGP